ncbi:hypothetical protein [Streptosporangium vulgare]|uniref:hypothetical protein n=1 Tax=Streptosporangium vulgare TaxID=46190 RepID=UPI0031E04BEA
MSTYGSPATTSRAVVPVTPVRRANSSALSGRQGAGPRPASSVRNSPSQPARLASPTGPEEHTV